MTRHPRGMRPTRLAPDGGHRWRKRPSPAPRVRPRARYRGCAAGVPRDQRMQGGHVGGNLGHGRRAGAAIGMMRMLHDGVPEQRRRVRHGGPDRTGGRPVGQRMAGRLNQWQAETVQRLLAAERDAGATRAASCHRLAQPQRRALRHRLQIDAQVAAANFRGTRSLHRRIMVAVRVEQPIGGRNRHQGAQHLIQERDPETLGRLGSHGGRWDARR